MPKTIKKNTGKIEIVKKGKKITKDN